MLLHDEDQRCDDAGEADDRSHCQEDAGDEMSRLRGKAQNAWKQQQQAWHEEKSQEKPEKRPWLLVQEVDAAARLRPYWTHY
mmetsp:Transcript_146196/g.257710  ORF Transcript_146196/g.257710 Transcript_146196/m.257710 type:complete len:82 (+) Transcript_146196:395-640(+)